MDSQIGRRKLMQWTVGGLAAVGLGGLSSGFSGVARAQAQPEGEEPAIKRVAMLVYPRFTALDLVGPNTAFGALENTQVDLVYKSITPVPTDAGYSVLPTKSFADVADDLEILFVPGGADGTVAVMEDEEVLDFLREKGRRAQRVTSVCSGSLVLGAAGLLHGYRATSHWSVRHLLPIFGAEAVDERYVADRNRHTGAGVSAGIDFGLHVVAEIAGPERAQLSQLVMEYAPEPPFDAGTPERAPQTVLQAADTALSAFVEHAQAAAERAARRRC